MLKLLVMCCVAAVWLQGPTGANADCCRTHMFTVKGPLGNPITGKVCNDCTGGTPYCSYGSCNLFGCKCDWPCREGHCNDVKFSFQKRALIMRSEDARDVIRSADVDGDGRMSLEEAKHHLASTGLPEDRVKRALEQLDYNHDQFISLQEIDSE